MSTLGINCLPEPLTAKEETQLLQELAFKCENRNILIDKNLRLVVHVAKKFQNTKIPMEELINTGFIGLSKATYTFAINKGNKFVTYAYRCIENEILMLLRKEQRDDKTLSLDDPYFLDMAGNNRLLSAIELSVPAFSSIIEKRNYISTLVTEILHMNYRYTIILLYRINNLSQEKIGQKFHCSQSYLARQQKKAYSELDKVAKKETSVAEKAEKKAIFSMHEDFFSVKLFDSNLKEKWNHFRYSYQVVRISKADYLEIRSTMIDFTFFTFLADFWVFSYTS